MNPPQQNGWFGRNWKWFVPVGCLSIIVMGVANDSGNADVRIPVSGPKKSGAIYATAIKKQGKWDFTVLEVEIEGETKRINLLAPSTE